jgi:hypothetical protein
MRNVLLLVSLIIAGELSTVAHDTNNRYISRLMQAAVTPKNLNPEQLDCNDDHRLLLGKHATSVVDIAAYSLFKVAK